MIHLVSSLAYTRVSCLFCVISIKMCKHLLDLITTGKVWEKTKCLEKNASTLCYDSYSTVWNTFAVCFYKKEVYKNEWLGEIHYKRRFVWKVNFLLNKDTEKALENLKTLETYTSSETDKRSTISSQYIKTDALFSTSYGNWVLYFLQSWGSISDHITIIQRQELIELPIKMYRSLAKLWETAEPIFR